MILVGIFALLQLVDGWSTYKIVANRIGREANPIVDAIIGRLGLFPGLLMVKGAAVAVVAAAGHYGAWEGDIGTALIAVLTAFYAWVCANNLRILRASRPS